MQALRRGLAEVVLPGRFQVLPGLPQTILDVAHNPEAAAALAAPGDGAGARRSAPTPRRQPMIRWMIGRRLSAAEREVGAPLDYLRHMLRYSVGALKAFAKIMPAARYRKVLPPAPFQGAGSRG